MKRAFPFLLVFLSIALAFGQEDELPAPAVFQQSALKGRELSNPFQAKIDRSMNKVTAFVEDSVELEEKVTERSTAEISKHFTVRMTLFFGENSDRNRAEINGKIKRPGDSLMSLFEGSREGVTTLALESIRRDGVTISWVSTEGKIKRLEIRSANARG